MVMLDTNMILRYLLAEQNLDFVDCILYAYI